MDPYEFVGALIIGAGISLVLSLTALIISIIATGAL